MGVRQSIETLEKHSEPMNTIDFEIIDQEFYADKSYHQYRGWENMLRDKLGPLNCNELEMDKCSLLTKVFIDKGTTPVKSFSITPYPKPRKSINSPFPQLWENIFKAASEERFA